MYIFLSGLVLFFLGLEGTKRSLKQAVSRKIKLLLTKLSNQIFLSIFMGILITALLQSSSAVSIIVISLIEAGLLKLKPSICIMLGANIGTTFTVQLISLPVLDYYPYLIFTGIVLIIYSFIGKEEDKNKKYYFGLALLSFGIVFAGLIMMTEFFKDNKSRELMIKILGISGSNLYFGILLGMVVTAIIQSSSAVTAITISLAANNLITLPVAIAIALGSNIGTCFTAFLASVNAGSVSRSLALSHFIFNIVGVLAILPVLNIFIEIIKITDNRLIRQIANAHTLFNTYNVIIFLPFIDKFINLIGGKSNGFD